MFKIKKKSIYFNYKMSKNPVSYGLIAGILGGLGFLGYKLFNGEDADQETINNAKKSVNFNIIDQNTIKEIEANESKGQNTDNKNSVLSSEADTTNTTITTNSSDLNINNEAEPESVEVIENGTEVKEENTSNSDLEIEAEEINLEPESEKKSVFQRQDSSINMEDTIDRIVTV